MTLTSDKRLKNNIVDLPLGIDFINKLHPVEYVRNNNTEQTKEWGVIAQELHQTLSDIGYKDAGIVTIDSTPEKFMAVRYNDLIAPLIKATQEQNKMIVNLVKSNEDLLKRIEALEKK
jgi:hypothetical protein